MKINIELLTGPYKNRQQATKKDVEGNIRSLERAVEGKLLSSDFQSLIDTKHILKCIQEQLPD